MWNWLQRMVGKSSASQEKLMQRMGKQVPITPKQLDAAKQLLQPWVLPAYRLELDQEDLPSKDEAFDHNGKSVPYYGSIKHPHYELRLFINLAKFEKDPASVQLLVSKRSDVKNMTSNMESLPTWESLIHLDVETHKNIVKLMPDNPWTLFKKAKSELVESTSISQVMGYPQWLINDIDYRKIEKYIFIFQIEITDKECITYFFLNEDSMEVQFFVQKND